MKDEIPSNTHPSPDGHGPDKGMDTQGTSSSPRNQAFLSLRYTCAASSSGDGRPVSTTGHGPESRDLETRRDKGIGNAPDTAISPTGPDDSLPGIPYVETAVIAQTAVFVGAPQGTACLFLIRQGWEIAIVSAKPCLDNQIRILARFAHKTFEGHTEGETVLLWQGKFELIAASLDLTTIEPTTTIVSARHHALVPDIGNLL